MYSSGWWQQKRQTYRKRILNEKRTRNTALVVLTLSLQWAFSFACLLFSLLCLFHCLPFYLPSKTVRSCNFFRFSAFKWKPHILVKEFSQMECSVCVCVRALKMYLCVVSRTRVEQFRCGETQWTKKYGSNGNRTSNKVAEIKMFIGESNAHLNLNTVVCRVLVTIAQQTTKKWPEMRGMGKAGELCFVFFFRCNFGSNLRLLKQHIYMMIAEAESFCLCRLLAYLTKNRRTKKKTTKGACRQILYALGSPYIKFCTREMSTKLCHCYVLYTHTSKTHNDCLRYEIY